MLDTAGFVINLVYMISLLTFVTMTTAVVCEPPERLTKLLNELLGNRESENMELDSQQVRLIEKNLHQDPYDRLHSSSI